MPKRTDLKTILIIGSGPIVIGQGCEFDYSGTQACKALREEGYQVVLVNSNPATIMTDPATADRTYIEPITPEAVAKIIAAEQHGPYHIDALLPTLGGQTALNCACKLFDDGVLAKFDVEMIGANREVIYRAEDRKIFKEIVESIGLGMPLAKTVNTMDEAWAWLEEVGLPAIIRPAFTLGGTGGGIAYNRDEFEEIVKRGLDASMTNQVLIDQSVLGWKEYELEVMRDHDDNVVIICSIENFDPMGVHTGDSITVAPAQTLSDKEYQRMRDAAMAIIRAVGVETGGSNIQFCIEPNTGEMLVVEMNPRVSRSSALASKATGFPIAKIAAKLAVGYNLWELPNDITGKTVACFEPTIDYVVTKIPRWTFEKFPEADETLTTQMKSVGEAMSIGRTFKESLQKGIRSMEVKRFGLGLDKQDKWLNAARWVLEQTPAKELEAPASGGGGESGQSRLQAAAELLEQPAVQARLAEAAQTSDGSQPRIEWPIEEDKLRRKLAVPSQGRMYYIRYAFKMGWSIEQVQELTHIDPWFLDQIMQLVEFERVLIGYDRLEDVPRDVLFAAKQQGYSDPQLANIYLGGITTETILQVRAHRKSLGITPVYKLVDTCAAEFEAATPYYYSTYEGPIHIAPGMPGADRAADASGTRGAGGATDAGSAQTPGMPGAMCDDEIRITPKPKVIILGGGPNRIGQGIEFDYCCVQAAFAAKELGYEAVMVNSNPETVSTDYDTSDLLFFEPLTFEDVLNICERLNGGELEGPRAKGQGPRDVQTAAGDESLGPRPSALGPLLHGVIVQFGGQTPLNLAHALQSAGVPIIGTPVESIDIAEDREHFAALCNRLGVKQPANGIARNIDQAIEIARKIGYPVLVRPSFVLGGRAMETVFDEQQLRQYFALALGASDLHDQPILIDKFLAEAIECDVDVVGDFGIADEPRAVIGAVMEHIEEAGIHSGDSACTIPPYSLPDDVVERLKEHSRALAGALKVCGLMNVQWAVRKGQGPREKGEGERGKGQGERDKGHGVDAGSLTPSPLSLSPSPLSPCSHDIFVIEVNPRASRTVPFVGKATGVPWANVAAKVMMGKSLAELGIDRDGESIGHTSVKESVFPFSKFPGVDVILGPEMRSTGEVMGIDREFPIAFAKSQMAAGVSLPTSGAVFITVRDGDKAAVVGPARALREMGFQIITTNGTHRYLSERGIESRLIKKISEGRPNAVDMIKNFELALIINTPTRKGIKSDEGKLRSTAVRFNVPMITTVTGASAAVQAIEALRQGAWDVRALQDYFPAAGVPGAVEQRV